MGTQIVDLGEAFNEWAKSNDNADQLANAVQLDPSQESAAVMLAAPEPGVRVMTGGPGTGKTTTLKEVIRRLRDRGMTVVLAAPTGKAAKRMSESTGDEASTLHRLIGAAERSYSGLIEADVVIVDEASMVDINLAAWLFAHLRPQALLLLVGDVDQLPPVGPGQVFADMIASGAVPVARLTTVHRSAAASWVGQNAQRIIRGEQPDLTERGDFRFLDVESGVGVAGAIIDALRDWQGPERPPVLVPQNTGPAGVTALNDRLQAEFCPWDGSGFERKLKGGVVYRLSKGDPVINTSNDYTRSRMNGEVGTVVRAGRKLVVVDYGDGRLAEYEGDAPVWLRLAYAITGHKSQGSEWPAVVVVCHSTHFRMLSRRWLYTVVTRAKQDGVILVGDEKGVRRAVSNGEDARRNSALAEKLTRVRRVA